MTTTVPEAFKGALTTYLRDQARIAPGAFGESAITRRRVDAIEVLANYVSALARDDARFEALYIANQGRGGKAGPQADYVPGKHQQTYVARLGGTGVAEVPPSASLDEIVAAATRDLFEYAQGFLANARETVTAREAETQRLRDAQESADELHARIEAETLRANVAEERAAELSEQVEMLRAATSVTSAPARPRRKPEVPAAA